MYDMSGFDYDIRDVVRVLNLQVRRKNPSSYDVDCPFCNHKTGKMTKKKEELLEESKKGWYNRKR